MLRSLILFGVFFFATPAVTVGASPAPIQPVIPAPLPAPSPTPDSGDDQGPTFGGGVSGDGEIEATARQPGSRGRDGSPAGPSTFRPACTWTKATTTNLGGVAIPEGDDNGDVNAQISDDAGRLGWLRFCPGDIEAVFVWLAPVDPIDLVPDARSRAVAQLQRPVPNMSPAPDVGSYVNLGLWLSVEDPGDRTARATLTPSVWAEVTGSFQSVSILPGDGSDAIVCDGLGAPYPDGANTFDEGPCGYTYTTTSPDGGFAMTFTMTYALTWRTSDGRSGTLGTFPRVTTIPYDVDEIQILGTSPN